MGLREGGGEVELIWLRVRISRDVDEVGRRCRGEWSLLGSQVGEVSRGRLELLRGGELLRLRRA